MKRETAAALGVELDVRKTESGLEVSVKLPEGEHNAWHQSRDDGFDVITRSVAIPAIGSTVMVDGRHVVVGSREFDDGRHLWLTDADTGLRVLWA